jgi:hypothetical protein
MQSGLFRTGSDFLSKKAGPRVSVGEDGQRLLESEFVPFVCNLGQIMHLHIPIFQTEGLERVLIAHFHQIVLIELFE